MNEPELFAAYRHHDHWETECACGDLIIARANDEAAMAAAIDAHNASPVHQQWREWQEAVKALQRPTRRPCPCSGHAA